jgi:hypothetical protein
VFLSRVQMLTPQKVTLVDFNKAIDEAYDHLFDGLDEDDEEGRKKRFAPILEHCRLKDEASSTPAETRRSITARMRSAADQFTGLASFFLSHVSFC